MDETFSYCSLPPVPPREFPAGTDPARVEAIVVNESKWVNHTVLHYYFFDRDTDGEHVFGSDGTRHWRPWTTDKAHQDVVRRAFDHWKAQDIGLEFVEVTSRDEAEIRIGYMQGDGAWSYLGRQILDRGVNERTMNFGWDLLRTPREADTALHEIGHTLGLPHEHQNPNAGIVWDEEKVYAELGGLLPFQSRELAILPGAQRDFVIRPTATRQYTLQTFGVSDTVMVLFERADGELRYQAGDDDSGEDRNATLQLKLFQGREYVLRVRLYFSQASGETAVMLW
jgi:hypothetical protein